MIVYAEFISKVCQLPSVKRKEKRTKHRSLRNATKKGGFCWKGMSYKDLLWPAWQVWWEPIKNGTTQADFCMKSLEEQRVIVSVKGSTQIQQHKKSIVSSINHYQQIVKYAKESCLSAMTTSVRRHANRLCRGVPAAGWQPLSQGSWTNRVSWTPDGSYRGPRGQDLAFLSMV